MSSHPPFEPSRERLLPPHVVAQIQRAAPEVFAAFDKTLTEQQLVDVPHLQRALRDLEDAVWSEDARMRREVLPSPPAGFRWAGRLTTSDDLVSAGVRIRLQYHLERIPNGGA